MIGADLPAILVQEIAAKYHVGILDVCYAKVEQVPYTDIYRLKIKPGLNYDVTGHMVAYIGGPTAAEKYLKPAPPLQPPVKDTKVGGQSAFDI